MTPIDTTMMADGFRNERSASLKKKASAVKNAPSDYRPFESVADNGGWSGVKSNNAETLSMADLFDGGGYHNASAPVRTARSAAPVSTLRVSAPVKSVTTETAVATQAEIDAAIEQGHKNTAADFTASKDALSIKLLEAVAASGGDQNAVEAEAAKCISMVANPFDRKQVDAMKNCFNQKIEAAMALAPPAVDKTQPEPEQGGGNIEETKTDSPALSIIEAGGTGFWNWKYTVAAAVSVAAILGFVGYKYYQSHSKK